MKHTAAECKPAAAWQARQPTLLAAGGTVHVQRAAVLFKFIYSIAQYIANLMQVCISRPIVAADEAGLLGEPD